MFFFLPSCIPLIVAISALSQFNISHIVRCLSPGVKGGGGCWEGGGIGSRGEATVQEGVDETKRNPWQRRREWSEWRQLGRCGLAINAADRRNKPWALRATAGIMEREGVCVACFSTKQMYNWNCAISSKLLKSWLKTTWISHNALYWFQISYTRL